MRVSDERAFVLHRYPYGETSFLLEIFSRTTGRVGVVARGARRGARSFGGAYLGPFQPLLLSWSSRGELGTLTRAEEFESPIPLQGQAVWCAFYVNELILRLLHRHEAHDELYTAYESVLHQLAVTGCDESVLRIFEKRLLAALGYGLALEREADTGCIIDSDVSYIYVLDEGPLVARQGLMGVTIGGSTLRALGTENFTDPHQLREAKTLLRLVLSRLLGEKPLYTRTLFRNLTEYA